jgi:hypothetical protein
LLPFFLQLILFLIIVLPQHTLDPLGFSYRAQVSPVLPVWFVVMVMIVLALFLFSAIQNLFRAVAAMKHRSQS